MNLWDGQRKLHLEVIQPDSEDQVSLHLSRHLPRRLRLGTVIIISDRPRVLLSVLGKRWAQLIRDLEREQSRTLDHTKRVFLGQEIARMRSCRFTTHLHHSGNAPNAVVASWSDIAKSSLNCFTLYITVYLQPQELAMATAFVSTGGLVVHYEVAPPDTDSAGNSAA
jgi:hypothetical protein